MRRLPIITVTKLNPLGFIHFSRTFEVADVVSGYFLRRRELHKSLRPRP